MLATDFNQLAIVAQNADRPADAERWYLRASEVYEKLERGNEQAIVFSNLANLYLAQGRLDDAERYARRAAAIQETLELSAAPWNTYNILASIASARGRAAEAAQWRRKEQDSYAAYAGNILDIQKWQEEITVVVAAAQGNGEAAEVAQQIIEHYQNSQDWKNLVSAFGRIIAGERDIEQLRSELDSTDFVIVHSILAQLSGAAPAPAPTPTTPQPQAEDEDEPQGITLEQLFGMVAQACRPDAPAGLAAHLHATTQGLATDTAQPAEIRALGRALNAILSGERNPDTSALPPALAEAVRALVAQIND